MTKKEQGGCMARKMRKWMAALLALTLITGSVQVYGEEQFVDVAEDIQEESRQDIIEPEDIFSSEEFTSGESEAFGEDSADLADEATEPEEVYDVTEEESLFEDVQDTNVQSEEYLTGLKVYAGNSENTPLEMNRREDLDEELQGKVYTVEYSSNYDSGSFYVTGDLSAAAPEEAKAVLSAWTLDHTQETTEMDVAASSKGLRYSLGSRIFTSGIQGGKRAVYTITAGTEGDSQVYKILVLRRLDLKNIRCYRSSDTDLTENLVRNFDTTGKTREYEAIVPAVDTSVKLLANAFKENWYQLKVNGITVSASDPVDVPLGTEETRIKLSMEVQDTYEDPAYQGSTYTSQGNYCVTVSRKAGTDLAFQVTPSQAVVSVYDAAGSRQIPDSDNLHLFHNILNGEAYTWTVSCYGYVGAHGTFTGGETALIQADLQEAAARHTEIQDNDWVNFRNSDTNNGVVNWETPENSSTALEKWSKKLGGSWEASVTPPLILGGQLYVASGKYIYRLDRNTGEIQETSDPLSGSMVYAMIPLTYAEGMLFAQIGGGKIQAISATTLKSLWISESIGGQTISPVTYKDGYIYTGTWDNETTAGTYFCLSVTDEDPTRGDEVKYCTWKYNHKGGFYWAGAYASKDYLVFGSDDGAENDYTNTAILYSVNTHTGLLIDQKTGLKGDIRSTIVYQNGYVYFTTKGGYLYRIAMNQNGTFGQTDSISLGGMATASPVVYKGRIYVGVCGTGGQFNPDGGHHFAVLTETSSGLSLAYNVSIPGYPQAAPLLSTAYENRDYNGDGLPDGRVYLYFTYNAKPGGIYMLTDAPGQTSGTAAEIFRPEKDQAEYCISTICADRDGTLYFKNDSNYLMAVECNGAYIDNVTAQSDAGTIKWKDMFRKSKTEHTLLIGEETKTVTLQFKALDGCTLSVNGQNITGAYTVDVSSGQAEVQVLAQCLGKSRKYVFHITRDQSVPALGNLTVSTSNTYSNVQARLAISPAFDRNTAEYRVLYTGDRDFINIFAETEESDAEVTAAGIQGTLKVSIFGKTTGSGNASRIAIYLDKSPEIQEAKVRITVRTRTGKTGDYILTIQRKEIIVTPTPTPVPDEPEVFGTWSTLSPATVFEPEVQQRTGSKGTVQTRTVGEKLSPTGKLNVKRIPLKIRQTTSKVSVSGLANGDLVKTWTSSNRKIVSVSKKGVIKGLRKGKATVTAVLASGKKLSLTVTVQAKTVKTKSITGLKGKLTLKRKGKLALKPVLSPITSQEKVSYMSSNSKIVAVNKRGVITGKKKGSAKITVKSGKKRKVIRVTVR